MRRRIAAGLAAFGFSLGALGASPAEAVPDAEDKAAKVVAHAVCGFEEAQEDLGEFFGVKANRGQCQKALRDFIRDL